MENTNINQNTSNQNIDNQEINIPVYNIPTDENNTGLDNVIDDYLNNGYPDENTYGTMSAGDNSRASFCPDQMVCKIDAGIDFTTPPPDETDPPTEKPTSPIQQEYADTAFQFYLHGYSLGGTYAIFSSGGQSITPTGLVKTGPLTPATSYISPDYANYWIYIYPGGSYMTNFNYIYKLKQEDFVSSDINVKKIYLTYNYSSSTVPNTNIYFPPSAKLATGQDLSCKGYRYDISKMSTITANVISIGTQTVYFNKIFTYVEINSIPQEKYLSGRTQTYFSNYEYNTYYKNLLNTTRNVTAAYTTQNTSGSINSNLLQTYTVTFTADQMTNVLTGKSVYYNINGVETDSIYLGNIYVGPEVTQTAKIINASYINGTSVPISYLNSGAIATCIRKSDETINYRLNLYYEIVKRDDNGNDVYVLARNVQTKDWNSALYNTLSYTRLNLSSNILSPTLFINSSYAPALNNTKNSTSFINNLENGTYAVRLRFEFSPSAASKPCSSGYTVKLNTTGLNIGLSYPLTHKCIKYSSIPRNPQVPIYLTLDHYSNTATHINIVTAQVGVKYYGIGSSSVKTADISQITWVYSNIASSASYTGNLYKQIGFKTNTSAAASTVTYTITCSIKAVKSIPLYSQGVMNSSTSTNWYQSGSKIRQITVTPMKYRSTVTHVFANLNDQLAGTNKVTELKVYVKKG